MRGEPEAGVMIQGGGVTAHCTAHLLRRAGIRAAVCESDRRPVPALMISHAALSLVRDVLEEPDLFRAAHRIDSRVVAWKPGAPAQRFPHFAITLSESQLLDGLRQSEAASGASAATGDSFRAQWAVLSAHGVASLGPLQSFGSREARTRRVWLANPDDASTCWMEALESGWLFMIPDGTRSAWLLSVGSDPSELLAASHLIRPRIHAHGAEAGRFPAHPRIAEALCGPGWLACGTAAMAFDPICGDGTAYAVRQSVLAAAVIRAACSGQDESRLLAHYQARLTAGFARHLGLCLEFYRSGPGGGWWRREAQLLERGLAWCGSKLRTGEGFHYRLEGCELLPVN